MNCYSSRSLVEGKAAFFLLSAWNLILQFTTCDYSKQWIDWPEGRKEEEGGRERTYISSPCLITINSVNSLRLIHPLGVQIPTGTKEKQPIFPSIKQIAFHQLFCVVIGSWEYPTFTQDVSLASRFQEAKFFRNASWNLMERGSFTFSSRCSISLSLDVYRGHNGHWGDLADWKEGRDSRERESSPLRFERERRGIMPPPISESITLYFHGVVFYHCSLLLQSVNGIYDRNGKEAIERVAQWLLRRYPSVRSLCFTWSLTLGCSPSGRWDKRRNEPIEGIKADEWQATWSISIPHEREITNLRPGFHPWKSNKYLMRLPTGLIILLRSSFRSCWVLDEPDGPLFPAATCEIMTVFMHHYRFLPN